MRQTVQHESSKGTGLSGGAARTKPGVLAISPDHMAKRQQLSKKRVSRIKGQIEGIERMLDSGRYCTEILQQIRAAQAALRGLECVILQNHMQGCVQQALSSKSPFDAQRKIDELTELLRSR